MSNNGYFKGPKSITVVVNGEQFIVHADNKSTYDEVWKLIQAKNYKDIPETIDRLAALTKKVAAQTTLGGEIRVRDRRVYFVEKDGVEQRLLGYEITKLLELVDQKVDIEPLKHFIVKVRQNPSEAVRARLYEFLEYGKMPLTEDGSFLAYKVVRGNYFDKHSGKFDNSIGKVVEMPREQVDDNDNRTCSTGLHACSQEYIQHFRSGGDRLVVVKIDPADVVSIPVDYNNTKMRTAKYKVIGELKDANDKGEFFGKAVYAEAKASPTRDKSGRFTRVAAQGAKRDSKGRFVRA